MKELLKKYKFDFPVIVVFILFAGTSYYMGFQPGINLLENNFWAFLKEMLVMLPVIFILIGLFDVWVPKEAIEKHIGETSGSKGIFLVIALALVQVGPMYAAYPVAYTLWKKGGSLRNIFIYIGSFSTLKIPMLTFEMGFLGLRFSLLRTFLTIPVFILIAVLMEKYLKNKNYEMKEPK